MLQRNAIIPYQPPKFEPIRSLASGSPVPQVDTGMLKRSDALRSVRISFGDAVVFPLLLALSQGLASKVQGSYCFHISPETLLQNYPALQALKSSVEPSPYSKNFQPW